jgi:hypothetical protein
MLPSGVDGTSVGELMEDYVSRTVTGRMAKWSSRTRGTRERGGRRPVSRYRRSLRPQDVGRAKSRRGLVRAPRMGCRADQPVACECVRESPPYSGMDKTPIAEAAVLDHSQRG